MAFLISQLRFLPRDLESDAGVDHRPLSPDAINLSSIQVAGVGGLGMVAVSVIVALSMPAVGVPVGAGLVTGALMAWFLIQRRRRRGVMPSSSKGPGANTILAIDAIDATDAIDTRDEQANQSDSAPGKSPRRVPEIAFQVR
jgi:hypothetical protein